MIVKKTPKRKLPIKPQVETGYTILVRNKEIGWLPLWTAPTTKLRAKKALKAWRDGGMFTNPKDTALAKITITTQLVQRGI